MPLLVERRTVLVPTLFGSLVLFVIAGALLSLWVFEGEAFLIQSERLPAQVLVVEGWIGQDGVAAAANEFTHGGYQFIAPTSGLSGDPWSRRRWSYASEARDQLVRLGIPQDRIILAQPPDADSHRTFLSAQAVLLAIRNRGLHPKAINVFTLGVHARRSRLVFAKVFGNDVMTGVIPWLPNGYNSYPWWQSSTRTVDFIKETAGYLAEILLNSGRGLNSTYHGMSLARSPNQ